MTDQLQVSSDHSVNARRSVGDVSGGLKDLKLLIDIHMTGVINKCEPVGASIKTKKICECQSQIEHLDGSPHLIASCSNTKGFVADSSGRVAKASSAADDEKACLPEPCLIVALSQDYQCVDHLTLLSLCGSVRLKIFANIDWSSKTIALCCDSARKALYIAKCDSVTVTDLSGCVSLIINAAKLNLPELEIFGMTSNTDKLFVLQYCAEVTSVLCIDKESCQLLTTVILDHVAPDWNIMECISVADNSLQLTDCPARQIHKFCLSSGQLIVSYPIGENLFSQFVGPPKEVLADSSGLLMASYPYTMELFYRPLVKILTR